MPTIFTDEDVQKYTRWQRFKMYAKIRAGMTCLGGELRRRRGGRRRVRRARRRLDAARRGAAHSSWLRLALDLWAQPSP